jgi:hypothetical protein
MARTKANKVRVLIVNPKGTKNIKVPIRIYGDSLVKKRHVLLNGFLFDDGWDNDSTLWQVSKKFPEGFTNLRKLANSYGVHLDLWISP